MGGPRSWSGAQRAGGPPAVSPWTARTSCCSVRRSGPGVDRVLLAHPDGDDVPRDAVDLAVQQAEAVGAGDVEPHPGDPGRVTADVPVPEVLAHDASVGGSSMATATAATTAAGARLGPSGTARASSAGSEIHDPSDVGDGGGIWSTCGQSPGRPGSGDGCPPAARAVAPVTGGAAGAPRAAITVPAAATSAPAGNRGAGSRGPRTARAASEASSTTVAARGQRSCTRPRSSVPPTPSTC